MSAPVTPPAARPPTPPAGRAAPTPRPPPSAHRFSAALQRPPASASTRTSVAAKPPAATGSARQAPQRERDPAPPRAHASGAPRRLDRALDADALAPFLPPSPVLALPPGARPEAPRATGDAADRAATAAMVDALVRSLRVGRVGRDGHEVRLRFDARAGLGDVEVRLRHEGGAVHATLVALDGRTDGADRLSARLGVALSERGVDLAGIDVERA